MTPADYPASQCFQERNYYGEPIVMPEHFMSKHEAIVPTAAGLPPLCTCGWTRWHDGTRWFELHEHLADNTEWNATFSTS